MKLSSLKSSERERNGEPLFFATQDATAAATAAEKKDY
jgi:hypothetical protein